MSAEPVLFIIVAVVAIFSAAFMLMSQNAVHAALFLVLNFLCVAFFYLMLNAPFLAAIQITVYAGAIMVLFMFVIMLLGADRLRSAGGKYGWMAPAAAVLTTILAAVSYFAISRSQIGTLQPVPPAPQVGFLHTVAGAGPVDLYLNEQPVAWEVTYGVEKALSGARAGDYTLLGYQACADANKQNCANPVTANAAPLFAEAVSLKPDTHTKVIIAGSPTTGLRAIPVALDLSTLTDENTLRVTVVNALPGDALVDVSEVKPPKQATILEPQNTAPVIEPLAGGMKFGDVSETKLYERGAHTFTFQRGTDRLATLREIVLRAKTHELMVIAPEVVSEGATQRATVIRFDDPPLRTQEAFGGPQAIGLAMLTTYVLPFELVSLLLLAAMVGAIVLTREEVSRRVRERLVVSPAIRHLNRRMTETVKPTAASPVSGGEGAESSAD
jgi:NADH-quinone oxidoreductase subunit J